MTGKLFGLPVLIAAGFGPMIPSTAQAQTYPHIDNLARRLEQQTAALHREVHLHFRPSPSYKHLDNDVAAMERLASHIHDVAHRRGSLAHLRSDVEELDRLYHHVEDVIRGMRFKGRLDFQALAHFRAIMADIGSTLHHLREDLDRMAFDSRNPGFGGPVVPYGPGIGLRIPLGDSGGLNTRLPLR